MVLLAIATGALGLLNYVWQANALLPQYLQAISVVEQLILTIVTVAAMVGYKGKRDRPSYDGGFYKVWTFRYAIIILSFIGNMALLV